MLSTVTRIMVTAFLCEWPAGRWRRCQRRADYLLMIIHAHHGHVKGTKVLAERLLHGDQLPDVSQILLPRIGVALDR